MTKKVFTIKGNVGVSDVDVVSPGSERTEPGKVITFEYGHARYDVSLTLREAGVLADALLRRPTLLNTFIN